MLSAVAALISFLVVYTSFTIFAVHRLKQDLFCSKLPRSSNPTSFQPISFFDEIFSPSEEKDYDELKELEEDVDALQAAKASMRPKKPAGKVYSVSLSLRKLEKKYEEYLDRYLNDSQGLNEEKNRITQLRNKIEFGHKAIEREKEIFLLSNGEYVRSFIFNRQNQLTDILLTGVSIPIVLEILNWKIKGIADLLVALKENPLMCVLAAVLWIVFLYRIMKYYKNKCSMNKDIGWAAEYDKAELMLCAFECALKNVENKIVV